MASNQQTSVDAASADSPFTITTYPSAAAAAAAQSTKSKKRKRGSSAGATPTPNSQGSGFHHQAAIAQLEGKFRNGQDLDMHYSVTPAKQWEGAKKYKSFRLNEASYMKGHYIYVANPDTVEKQKAAGARNPTEEWVAQILEIRAVDEQHVFVRVAWLYWPQELPKRTLDRGKFVQGRQPYHGTHELVASNHMDIIHALSVTEHAKVDRWVESEQDSVLAALYWRQGFDIRTGELSSVTPTCRCQMPVNPDKTLIMCTSINCGKWLHYECLEDDILTKTWEKKCQDPVKKEEDVDQSNGLVKSEQAESPLPIRNILNKEPDTPQANGNGRRRSSSRQASLSTQVPPSTPLSRQGSVRGKGKKAPPPKPYKGLFEATLKTDDGSAHWNVRDLRDGVPDGNKSWTEPVHCLLCDSVIV